MSDDIIAKDILKFVKLLDGGESEDSVFRAAVARNWLDRHGAPTHDGRQLIRSFEPLWRVEQFRK